MIITGAYASATVYAGVIEEGAISQIRSLLDCKAAEGSRIRIMPDVHTGTGCTIGLTMTVEDRVVPNIVGVDIGCGMYTVEIKERSPDLARLDEAAHHVPSGRQVHEGRMERFDLTGLRCFRALEDTRRLQRSLGTLGGGNHFIEVDQADDGRLFLVIHSGSRALGRQVAEHYQHLAVDLHQGCGEYLRARESMIAEYKAAGLRAELRSALKQLSWERQPLTVPPELCWLEGSFMADNLHDAAICQRFAQRNRELIAEQLLVRAGLTAVDAFHTVHNYIDTQEMILRKSAVAAHAGERLLIPINMRDGAILASGRGNPDWNFSAPHGAGCLMSRTTARQTLSLEDFRAVMRGVYTTSVSEATLDEAPMAYKSIGDVIDYIGDSVDIKDVLHPIYNFKASG